MDPLLFLRQTAWPFRPVTTAILAGFALLYVGSWIGLRRGGSRLAAGRRLFFFAVGVLAMSVALVSPVHTLHRELLIGRAAQQILLGLVAPPFLWLACPFHIIARRLPGHGRRRLMHTLRADSLSGRFVRTVTRPALVWLTMLSVFLLWHEPQITDWILGHEYVYASALWLFWAVNMLFWWHAVGTGPRLHPLLPTGLAVIYVVLGGEVPNMATGVTLAFGGVPVYRFYAAHETAWGLSALQDQMISGGMIWVIGSLVYVSAAIVIVGRVLHNEDAPLPPPISWQATERTIAPGLEHRVVP